MRPCPVPRHRGPLNPGPVPARWAPLPRPPQRLPRTTGWASPNWGVSTASPRFRPAACSCWPACAALRGSPPPAPCARGSPSAPIPAITTRPSGAATAAPPPSAAQPGGPLGRSAQRPAAGLSLDLRLRW